MDGETLGLLQDALNIVGASLGGSLLNGLTSYDDYDTEAITAYGDLILGDLRTALLEFSIPTEALSVSGDLLSGTLNKVLVVYGNYSPEAVTSQGSILSGTLST